MCGCFVDYLEFRNNEALHDPMKAAGLEAPAMRAATSVLHMIIGADPELLALADIDRGTVGMVTMMIRNGRVTDRINDIGEAISELSNPLDFSFHPKLEVPQLWISDVTGHQNLHSLCLDNARDPKPFWRCGAGS